LNRETTQHAVSRIDLSLRIRLHSSVRPSGPGLRIDAP
jgi:hypothetical protein